MVFLQGQVVLRTELDTDFGISGDNQASVGEKVVADERV
jgi:hypothetical protein